MKKKGDILIIEDSPTQMIYLQKELEDAGFFVMTALSGEEAVDLLKKEKIPEIVLLDIVLPGMNGFELCKILKKDNITKNIGVIFLTDQHKSEEKIVEGLRVGGDDYILKPYKMIELIARIDVVLRIKKLQNELIESEKLKAILQLAGAAAHEINNPLNVLLCNLEYVFENIKNKFKPDVVEALTDCYESAQKISEIVKNIREIKRVETVEYTSDVDIIDINKSSK
ncbi:MAG: response regulator [Candidatus Aureabacteria bacterium]|nr:response regulator [Candidatus Auribacterota bacterium]